MRPGDNGYEGPGAGVGTQRGLIMLFPFVQFTDGAIAGTEHSPPLRGRTKDACSCLEEA